MYCIDCSNREICTRPCMAVEKVLEEMYSLKSNYLVKFVNPSVIEEMCVANYVHKPSCRKVKLHKILRIAIEALPLNQKNSIEMYYGFDNGEMKTQAEVAKLLGVTQRTVGYRLKVAREKLLRFIAFKMIV